MSSRLHHKWHRHNHHTDPTPNVDLPDSGHDPIASPESPFQGTFALNGMLSSSQEGRFTGNPALILQTNNLGLSSNGGMYLGGVATFDGSEIRVRRVRVVTPTQPLGFNPVQSFDFTPVVNSGKFLEVIIDNQSYWIPLWQA
jgi:hypothetical protein